MARINGEAVHLSDYRAFVDVARYPGYRPATRTEANRLLRALLRERLVVQEAERRGLSLEASGRDALIQILVEETATPVLVGDADVRRYLERADRAFPGADFSGSAAEGQHALELLRARRTALQRTAVLDLLLERAHVQIEGDLLRRLSPPPASGPPRPPIPEVSSEDRERARS